MLKMIYRGVGYVGHIVGAKTALGLSRQGAASCTVTIATKNSKKSYIRAAKSVVESKQAGLFFYSRALLRYLAAG